MCSCFIYKSKLPSMHDTSLAWLTRSLPATKQVDDGGWSSEKLGVTAGQSRHSPGFWLQMHFACTHLWSSVKTLQHKAWQVKEVIGKLIHQAQLDPVSISEHPNPRTLSKSSCEPVQVAQNTQI